MSKDLSTLKEILELSFSRYISVLPNGFKLPYNNNIFPSLKLFYHFLNQQEHYIKTKNLIVEV